MGRRPRLRHRRCVRDFQALVAPLLVDSHDLQGAVFEAGIPAQMLEGLGKLDLVGIGVLPGPMRKLLGVSKQFVRSADFAGAVVGIQDSAVAKHTFSAFGATAQPVPSSAGLDGLDAYEQQLGSIVGNHYSAGAGYVTGNINLWPRPLVIFMNHAAFDALTADQQATLKEAAAETVGQALDDSQTEDAEAAPLLCQEGMTFVAATDRELDELRTTLQPVYDDLAADPATKAYLDAITTLKRELVAPPDAAKCRTTNASTAVNLDGTYEQTLTGADILASGCDAPGLDGVEPETESYTELRLHDGLAEHYSRTNGDSLERGFIGTYSVFRDRMQIDETGGASFSVHWEFDGNQLVLSDLEFGHVVGEGCDHVVAWTTKPWLLVDAASNSATTTPGDS